LVPGSAFPPASPSGAVLTRRRADPAVGTDQGPRSKLLRRTFARVRWPGRPRRRAAAGFAIAALALGACTPLPPPPPPPPSAPFVAQYCAPAAPSTPAEYQAAFDQVRKVGTEWVAADGGSPVTLPDGRVLWIYGDTFTGRIAADGSLAPGWRLVHNSFILQDGACFQPVMGGSPDARSDLIPAPSGEWHWPTAGVVEHTASGDVLRVFSYHETHSAGPAPFNLVLLDMQITTFTLPDLRFLSTQALPNGIGSDQTHPWGQAALVVGPTVYVFGRGTDPNANGPDVGRDHRVARVALGSLTTGPWQFYKGGTTGTDTDWASAPSAAALVTFVADNPALPPGAPSAKPYDPMFVVPRPSGGYLSVGKLGELVPGIFATEISAWTAATPQGPWHSEGKIAATSIPGNQYSYGARLELNLPGGTPTVLYSVSSFDDLTKNVSLYGVKFEPPSGVP
jgi:hypothetical protein